MVGKLALLGLVLLVPATVAVAEDGQGQPVFRQEGQASYYGDDAKGKKTASGERFDPAKSVAAHPTLPLGSEVTVKSPETGKEVTVRVIDRGPNAPDRDIDLSKGAAKKLGITKEGVASVEFEATKKQVEKAIDTPQEAPKVEQQLKEARQEAAQQGTPQPKPAPKLDPPQQ
jgi:rare lipoprotein A